MKIKIEGIDSLKAKINHLQNADLGEAAKRAATDIYNMGQTRTPKKTGELRTSMAVNQLSETAYEVGYAKEYAPHVEYGHRLVIHGNQVGYVEGQYFFREMVEDEKPKFSEYLKQKIDEAMK